MGRNEAGSSSKRDRRSGDNRVNWREKWREDTGREKGWEVKGGQEED